MAVFQLSWVVFVLSNDHALKKIIFKFERIEEINIFRNCTYHLGLSTNQKKKKKHT